jgi:hypothetical protein
VVLGSLACSLLGACGGASHQVAVLPAGAKVAGKSYAEWEREWSRWRYSLPRDSAAPADDLCISAGQRAPVWFLGGNAISRNIGLAKRRCTIPHGRYLMVGVPSWSSTSAEMRNPRSVSNGELERSARAGWRRVRASNFLSLDGRALKPPGVLVATPAFAFVMPPIDNYAGLLGVAGGRAAVYGEAALLVPLTPGKHTLVAGGHYAGEKPERAVYELTVR